jgi:hypothetical protein
MISVVHRVTTMNVISMVVIHLNSYRKFRTISRESQRQDGGLRIKQCSSLLLRIFSGTPSSGSRIAFLKTLLVIFLYQYSIWRSTTRFSLTGLLRFKRLRTFMRPPAPQHDAVTISEEGRRLDLNLDMSKTPTGKRWQDFFFLSEYEELDTSFPPVLEYYASAAQVVNLLVTFPAEEEGWRWSQGLDQTKLLCAVASHLSQFTSLTTLDITFQVPGPGHYNPHDRYMNAGRARIKNIIYFWTLPFQDWNFWVLDLGTDEWTKYFVEEEGYTERDLRLMRYAAELKVKEMKMEERAQWTQ